MTELTRAENVAKHGCSHAKEAEGLHIAKTVIEKDGRMVFVKSAEGARADFCVHRPGDGAHAIGVQLKTTASIWSNHGHDNYVFGKTAGYGGMLLLLISLHGRPRCWVVPGDRVREAKIRVHLTAPKRRRRFNWEQSEVEVAALPDALLSAFEQGTCTLRPVQDIVVPSSPSRRVEYLAFLWLKGKLPLAFIEPPVEHRPYDYTVDGARWQLKVVTYLRGAFHVSIDRTIGRVDHKSRRGGYSADCFDFLCLQMPLSPPPQAVVSPRIYLIPMSVLLSRGIAGTEKRGCISVPQHRLKATHADGAHWIQAFLIRLDTVDVAISDYRAVVARSLPAGQSTV